VVIMAEPTSCTIARRVLSTMRARRLKLIAEQAALGRRIADCDKTIADAKRIISRFDIERTAGVPGGNAA
jgi:hypothetical protein